MNNPNLDKLAIGAAAIIILGFIGFTLFGADPVADAVEKIKTHKSAIEEKGGPNQTLPSAVAPDVLESIRPGFTGLDESAQFTRWSFYRRPGAARVSQAVVIEPSTHTGPKLTKIIQKRDKDLTKPVHVIEGVGATVMHGEITRQAIETRESGTEAWTTVTDVPAGEGEFSIQIDNVESGKTYDYRVVSVAKSNSKAGFGDPTQLEDTQVSGEYSAEVPHDIVWVATSPRAMTGDGKPGSCFLNRKRWNYDEDKVDPDRDQFYAAIKSTDLPGLPKIFDTDYKLRRVSEKTHPERGKEFQVELIDVVTKDRLILWAKEPARSLEASDVVGDSIEAEGDGEGDAEGEAEKPAAEVEKPKAKPPTTGSDDDF